MIIELLIGAGAIVLFWLCRDKKRAKEREDEMEHSQFMGRE